ncbi:MAG: class I SAM-dependent methyltransferase [Spirochaetales bacterium]|nr:class I SAM-dependent methyltransferase [Spirochaetales bacterium]
MNRKEETKQFYNAVADKTFKEWFDNPALLPSLKYFITKLPENPKVLDLGCGTGGESKRLVGLGADVIGVDFSEESIAYAVKNVPEAQFIITDIGSMEFETSSFDGIIEAGVLFHFDSKEQDRIIKNIFDILKPGGIFQSYYPEGNFEGMQDIDFSGIHYRRYSRQISKANWIEQVLRCGFTGYSEYEFNLGNFFCIAFTR